MLIKTYTCTGADHTIKGLSTGIRTFSCPNCGAKLDPSQVQEISRENLFEGFVPQILLGAAALIGISGLTFLLMNVFHVPDGWALCIGIPLGALLGVSVIGCPLALVRRKIVESHYAGLSRSWLGKALYVIAALFLSNIVATIITVQFIGKASPTALSLARLSLTIGGTIFLIRYWVTHRKNDT